MAHDIQIQMRYHKFYVRFVKSHIIISTCKCRFVEIALFIIEQSISIFYSRYVCISFLKVYDLLRLNFKTKSAISHKKKTKHIIFNRIHILTYLIELKQNKKYIKK